MLCVIVRIIYPNVPPKISLNICVFLRNQSSILGSLSLTYFHTHKDETKTNRIMNTRYVFCFVGFFLPTIMLS